MVSRRTTSADKPPPSPLPPKCCNFASQLGCCFGGTLRGVCAQHEKVSSSLWRNETRRSERQDHGIPDPQRTRPRLGACESGACSSPRTDDCAPRPWARVARPGGPRREHLRAHPSSHSRHTNRSSQPCRAVSTTVDFRAARCGAREDVSVYNELVVHNTHARAQENNRSRRVSAHETVQSGDK